jgi:hypothetical protein
MEHLRAGRNSQSVVLDGFWARILLRALPDRLKAELRTAGSALDAEYASYNWPIGSIPPSQRQSLLRY